MKKSLMAEQLFAEGVGPSQKIDDIPIAGVQAAWHMTYVQGARSKDAEDLYEALLIHQQICRMKLGRSALTRP